MRKYVLAAAIAAAVTVCVPSQSQAGERCRPIRTAVANLVERVKARTARVGRFACQVAATVRPVVTVSMVNSRPTVGFSYTFAGNCANGTCPSK